MSDFEINEIHGRNNRGALMILAISAALAIIVGIGFTMEYISSLPDKNALKASGTVIERDHVMVMLVFKRPQLSIQVEGSKEIVNAILMNDSSKDIPDNVDFYYVPLSSDEVYLQQETSPLVSVFICLGVVLLALAAFAYEKRKNKLSLVEDVDSF